MDEVFYIQPITFVAFSSLLLVFGLCLCCNHRQDDQGERNEQQDRYVETEDEPEGIPAEGIVLAEEVIPTASEVSSEASTEASTDASSASASSGEWWIA